MNCNDTVQQAFSRTLPELYPLISATQIFILTALEISIVLWYTHFRKLYAGTADDPGGRGMIVKETLRDIVNQYDPIGLLGNC